MKAIEDLYLDLLRRSLTNHLFLEKGSSDDLADVRLTGNPLFSILRFPLWMARAMRNRLLAQRTRLERRAEGTDWPATAETMVGLKRLESLQTIIKDILDRGVDGDLIEAGTWRGGSAIFMRGVLEAYGATGRKLWVADSFGGLPSPSKGVKPDRFSLYHRFDCLAVSLSEVRRNFQRYHLLDDSVIFLEGWFKDTLASAPMEKLALVRMDGDMYESTMDTLNALYPRLSSGGYLVIDDYGAVRACQRAVRDYREQHGIREEIQWIDWTGAYWKKS